jgi:hypothetical protein
MIATPFSSGCGRGNPFEHNNSSVSMCGVNRTYKGSEGIFDPETVLHSV